MFKPVQFQYSLKFSSITLALMVVFMLIVTNNVIKANNLFGWIIYGIFALFFCFLAILMVAKRLIPALQGKTALGLDNEGISDHVRDISISWNDIKEITLISRRGAILLIDLKWESELGSQIAVPLRWVKGKDHEIFDAVMMYFEQVDITE